MIVRTAGTETMVATIRNIAIKGATLTSEDVREETGGNSIKKLTPFRSDTTFTKTSEAKRNTNTIDNLFIKGL